MPTKENRRLPAGRKSKVAVKSKPQRKARGKREGVVAAPVAMTRVMRTGMPEVSGSAYIGDGRTRIRHREYIQEIFGSVAFSNVQIPINPGIDSMFTWLPPLAKQFESYLFRKLRFCFETEKSSATNGTVMIAVDYDAADTPPVNKSQIMAFHNAVRSSVWNECCFEGDIADLRKFGVQRYVRSGALAANQDVKTYDVGSLNVATQGCADTSAIGELYVEYDVELITPQVLSDPDLPDSFTQGFTGSTRALPFTTPGPITGGLSVVASGSTLTFNKVGKYLLEITDVGTVMTDVAPTVTGTATIGNGGAPIGGFQYHTTAALGACFGYLVLVSDKGQTVILDFTPAATTVTSCVVRVASFSGVS